MKKFPSVLLNSILSWNCIQLSFCLIFIVISHHFNISQCHILGLRHRYLEEEIPQPKLNSAEEIAQITFISGLRHKRDLTERDFHIIQVFRPSTNSTIVIHLSRKSTLVSSDFKVVLRDGDDEPEILSGEEVESNCLYHGSILDDPDGRAALSACGEHLGFSGLIMNRDGHWMIEPHPHPVNVNSLQETLEVPHVIHLPETTQASQQCNSDELRVPPEELANAAELDRIEREQNSEVNSQETAESLPKTQQTTADFENENVFTGRSTSLLTLVSKEEDLNSDDPKNTEKRHTKETNETKKTVEIAVFADEDFYNQMKIRYPKETMNKIKNYVLTVINSMDLLYEQPSLGVALNFRLVHLEIQKKWPSKLKKHDGTAKSYLTSFCDYAGALNTANGLWDHALLLTGGDLVEEGSSATAGLAWAGTMCYRYYSCSISEATQFGVVYVITHEIGHSMGMEHDGFGISKKCDKEKYLMSPTTGSGKVSWSTCSNQNLKDFIEHGTSEPKERKGAVVPYCLTESSRETKTIDYTSSSLPGQKYDANKQCALAMGKKFTSVMRKASPFNNICSMLYCGNTTHSISTHPALEGTLCDTEKYCRGGKCVKK